MVEEGRQEITERNRKELLLPRGAPVRSATNRRKLCFLLPRSSATRRGHHEVRFSIFSRTPTTTRLLVSFTCSHYKVATSLAIACLASARCMLCGGRHAASEPHSVPSATYTRHSRQVQTCPVRIGVHLLATGVFWRRLLGSKGSVKRGVLCHRRCFVRDG